MNIWSEMDRNARIGLSVGVALVVTLAVFLLFWLMPGKQSVLYAQLDQQEAAGIVSALEEMKVPYSLDENGSSILVDSSKVQEVRLKLVGKGIPVNAGSGFELFDNADIGMTEYSQKINYLRAMQGELARSIMSIDGIKYARVHLVLPETSLFKQKKTASTASVTLVPEPGVVLSAEQILGIQRLVASSAPGITENEVTVIDNNGITISRVSPEADRENITTLVLQKKREAEAYLEKKIKTILDKAFGDGKAVATVSVEIAVNKVHRKDELVLPNPNKDTGVLKKRESINGGGKGSDARDSKTVEIEFQVSRRIEEIVSMPGAIQRINVGAMVPETATQEQISNLKDIISMSVGIDAARGDDVAIYAMKSGVIDNVVKSRAEPAEIENVLPETAMPPNLSGIDELTKNKSLMYLFGGCLVLVMVLLVMLLRSIGKGKKAAGKHLSAEEREKLLSDIKQWLNSEGAA